MNSIELTEEHKSKLLEMCETLFPKYDFTLDKWEFCFVTFGLKTYSLYTEHIHWFEFCMTHLSEKIDCDLAHNIIYMKKHPIDYLYEEFKKLNNG